MSNNENVSPLITSSDKILNFNQYESHLDKIITQYKSQLDSIKSSRDPRHDSNSKKSPHSNNRPKKADYYISNNNSPYNTNKNFDFLKGQKFSNNNQAKNTFSSLPPKISKDKLKDREDYIKINSNINVLNNPDKIHANENDSCRTYNDHKNSDTNSVNVSESIHNEDKSFLKENLLDRNKYYNENKDDYNFNKENNNKNKLKFNYDYDYKNVLENKENVINKFSVLNDLNKNKKNLDQNNYDNSNDYNKRNIEEEIKNKNISLKKNNSFSYKNMKEPNREKENYYKYEDKKFNNRHILENKNYSISSKEKERNYENSDKDISIKNKLNKYEKFNNTHVKNREKNSVNNSYEEEEEKYKYKTQKKNTEVKRKNKNSKDDSYYDENNKNKDYSLEEENRKLSEKIISCTIKYKNLEMELKNSEENKKKLGEELENFEEKLQDMENHYFKIIKEKDENLNNLKKQINSFEKEEVKNINNQISVFKNLKLFFLNHLKNLRISDDIKKKYVNFFNLDMKIL